MQTELSLPFVAHVIHVLILLFNDHHFSRIPLVKGETAYTNHEDRNSPSQILEMRFSHQTDKHS